VKETISDLQSVVTHDIDAAGNQLSFRPSAELVILKGKGTGEDEVIGE
jgi:hypothetical protein